MTPFYGCSNGQCPKERRSTEKIAGQNVMWGSTFVWFCLAEQSKYATSFPLCWLYTERCYAFRSYTTSLSASPNRNACPTRCRQRRPADFALMPLSGKVDQTMMSDVRLVPPPCELNETYASSLIMTYSFHYVKT